MEFSIKTGAEHDPQIRFETTQATALPPSQPLGSVAEGGNPWRRAVRVAEVEAVAGRASSGACVTATHQIARIGHCTSSRARRREGFDQPHADTDAVDLSHESDLDGHHSGREHGHRSRRRQPLLPAGVSRLPGLRGQRDTHDLTLEGRGPLLRRDRRWRAQPGCGVVLPGHVGGRCEHQGAGGVLEGRQRGGVGRLEGLRCREFRSATLGGSASRRWRSCRSGCWRFVATG